MTQNANQQEISIALYIQSKIINDLYQLEAPLETTFYDLIQSIRQFQQKQNSQKIPKISKQLIKIISKGSDKAQEYYPDQKLKEIKKNSTNKYAFNVSWSENLVNQPKNLNNAQVNILPKQEAKNLDQKQKNPQKQINIYFLDKNLKRRVKEQQSINQIIDEIKTQININSSTQLQIKIRSNNKQQIVNGQQKVKFLTKKYGLNYSIIIIPCYNNSIIQINDISNIKQSRLNQLEIQQIQKILGSKVKQIQNKNINIIIMLNDLNNQIQINKQYPNVYCFNDIFQKLEPQFKQYFQGWGKMNQQEQVIVQDLDNNGNQFAKLDQPLVRLFPKSTQKRFAITRKYPGG